MKKYLSVLPVLILPYVLLFFMIMLETGFLIDTYFDNFIFIPMLLLILFYGLAIIDSIIYAVVNINKKNDSLSILRMNMIIKVFHIPAYIVIFIIGISFSITFLFIVSVILVFLDFVTIFCSGLIGLTGLINAQKENQFSKKEVIINGVLQFVFCLDIASAIYIYFNKKNNLID